MEPELLQKEVYKLVTRLENFISHTKLAGLMTLSDKEYEWLAAYSCQLYRDEIEDFQGSLFKRDKIKRGTIVSLFLFHWGIREYQHQFWNELSDKIGMDSQFVQKFSKECISYFCNEYDTFFYNNNDRNAFVTTILTHSVLPESHITSFLDLLIDLYIHDLEEEIDEAAVV